MRAFFFIIADDLISSVTFHPRSGRKNKPGIYEPLMRLASAVPAVRFLQYRSETMAELGWGGGGSPGSPRVQFKRFI